MKKKVEHELEIIKAVAQAWHVHSSTTSTTATSNEFDVRRLDFKSKPTRFKLEAMTKSSLVNGGVSWDFRQSLWDSYEIVAVSKRLEAGLVLDHQFVAAEDGDTKVGRRRKESRNSLRNILNRTASRRFDD